MGKQSKREKRRNRQRLNSRLSSHRQEGRILKPPFKSLPGLRTLSWEKRLLPDMIWMCSLLATCEHEVAIPIIVQSLDVVDAVVRSLLHDEESDMAPFVDGRLTSFDRVPEEAHNLVLAELENKGLYESAVPEGFAHALGMYSIAPGRWILEPWLNRGLSIDWETARGYLAPVIVESQDGRAAVATRAKAILVGRHVKAGRIRISQDVDLPFELMRKYPFGLTEDELMQVDAISRAMFMGIVGSESARTELPQSERWAQSFWRSNWQIYPCLTDDDGVQTVGETAAINEASAHYRVQVETIHQTFLDIALKTDPDLYEPDRYEVLSGIVSRALRLAAAAASTPILWSGEHGSPVVRSLVESLIVLRWLVKRNEPALFSQFKEYGRGRLKLLKLHLEEYVDSLNEPAEELQQYLDYLDAEVNSEVLEEFQDISIESTFSGVNARDMAIEVGMDREYRLQFAPASSATHGEWSTLDRYVLHRCRNPLHRGHRIPRQSLSTSIGAQLMETVLALAHDLVDDYISAIRSSSLGNKNRSAA